MTLAIDELGPAALELRPEGILRQKDYERFVPEAERRIEENGHVNLLVNPSRLEGATPSALWEDLRFDAKHRRDFTRVAVVGANDSSRQQWLVQVAKPFTSATVEFYFAKDLPAARAWVKGED